MYVCERDRQRNRDRDRECMCLWCMTACMCMDSHALVHRGWRMRLLSVLYDSPPCSLESGSLTEPRARLVASKIQRFSVVCHHNPGTHGYARLALWSYQRSGVGVSSFTHVPWSPKCQPLMIKAVFSVLFREDTSFPTKKPLYVGNVRPNGLLP